MRVYPDHFAAMMAANDLDNLNMIIEALPPHPKYTEAQTAVQRARQALIEGLTDIHQREMKERLK